MIVFEIQYRVIGEENVRTASYYATTRQDAHQQFWRDMRPFWQDIKVISTKLSVRG